MGEYRRILLDGYATVVECEADLLIANDTDLLPPSDHR